ncbi:MAG: hypothetical protein AB3N64_10100 [Puniceicoccaceae bacterium]
MTVFLILSGCANFTTVQGVSSPFEGDGAIAWERGVTTKTAVLEALGPPSQIIALHEGTVLYYLRERGAGSAKIFILYNTGNLEVEYDRAVFFFDSEGILTEYSYSKEKPAD